ncbi:MAG: hypothetical protein ACXQTR_02600 [Candidatus Methanospirareceae archaeon]
MAIIRCEYSVRPCSMADIEAKLIALSKDEDVTSFNIDIDTISLRRAIKMHIDAIETCWHEKYVNEHRIGEHLDAIRELLKKDF